jgi:hypothetical protein
MKKALAAGVLAAAVIGTTAACGPGANSTYCVNHLTGQVMPGSYCTVGGVGYNPLMYDYWYGNTHSHTYIVGGTIPRSYFSSGKQVNPSDSAARQKAGLPVSGSIGNGATSKPASPQPAPKPPTSTSTSKVGGSTGGTSSTSKSSGSIGGSTGSTSKSSGSFSSGSTSRSSGGFSGSVGGRK